MLEKVESSVVKDVEMTSVTRQEELEESKYLVVGDAFPVSQSQR